MPMMGEADDVVASAAEDDGKGVGKRSSCTVLARRFSDSHCRLSEVVVVAQMSGSSLKGGCSSCFAGFCSTSTVIESVDLPLNGTLMPRKLMVAPGHSSVREPRAAARMSKLVLLTTRPRFLSLK